MDRLSEQNKRSEAKHCGASERVERADSRSDRANLGPERAALK